MIMPISDSKKRGKRTSMFNCAMIIVTFVNMLLSVQLNQYCYSLKAFVMMPIV